MPGALTWHGARLALERRADWVFRGEVSPWYYAALRVGLATIFIVRHSNWLAPCLPLNHHRWVEGLDFSWSIPSAPYLVSPLVPGLVLGQKSTLFLVQARTVLSFALLLGIRARGAALLLAAVSYALLAADRYRYFHHLHLLYLSIAWSAFGPLDARLSLERALRRLWSKPDRPETSPLWPLELLRGLVIGVYLASGLSKLDPAWLRGENLRWLARLDMLGGPVWTTLEGWLGFSGVARLTCATELALPLALMLPRTRHWAIGAALIFHALLSMSMSVGTFGVEMAILLLAFVPR
jgi:hypothetical protein